MHLVSTIDEVLALALQPVSSDVRPQTPGGKRRSRRSAKRRASHRRAAVNRSEQDFEPPLSRQTCVASFGRLVRTPCLDRFLRPSFAPVIESRLLAAVSTSISGRTSSPPQIPAGSDGLTPRNGRDSQPPMSSSRSPRRWDELALVHTADYLAKMRDGTLVARGPRPARAAVVRGDGRRFPRRWWAEPSRPRGSRAGCCDGSKAVPEQAREHGFRPCRVVLSPRRRPASRVPEPRRRLLSLQRCRGRGSRAPGARHRARRHRRPRRPPRQRHGVHLRVRTPRVFTFSMHQQHNYPMWKPRGSLDIGLPDGADDAAYLRELERALPTVMASAPQCVFYLAGADPYEDDQLGGLRLTREGLRQRDRLVIETRCAPPASRSSSRSRAAMRAASRTRSRSTWRRSRKPRPLAYEATKARKHETILKLAVRCPHPFSELS